MRKMKDVARRYATPGISVHSRADAGDDEDDGMHTRTGLNRPGCVVQGVRIELREKIDIVVSGQGGIRRRMVIADLGIGFSKDVRGNLEILGDAAGDVEDGVIHEGGDGFLKRRPLRGYSLLIAASRKVSLQGILRGGDGGGETTSKGRVFATATAVACAVQQGALAVCVHDVQEMFDVCKVADALW